MSDFAAHVDEFSARIHRTRSEMAAWGQHLRSPQTSSPDALPPGANSPQELPRTMTANEGTLTVSSPATMSRSKSPSCATRSSSSPFGSAQTPIPSVAVFNIVDTNGDVLGGRPNNRIPTLSKVPPEGSHDVAHDAITPRGMSRGLQSDTLTGTSEVDRTFIIEELTFLAEVGDATSRNLFTLEEELAQAAEAKNAAEFRAKRAEEAEESIKKLLQDVEAALSASRSSSQHLQMVITAERTKAAAQWKAQVSTSQDESVDLVEEIHGLKSRLSAADQRAVAAEAASTTASQALVQAQTSHGMLAERLQEVEAAKWAVQRQLEKSCRERASGSEEVKQDTRRMEERMSEVSVADAKTITELRSEVGHLWKANSASEGRAFAAEGLAEGSKSRVEAVEEALERSTVIEVQLQQDLFKAREDAGAAWEQLQQRSMKEDSATSEFIVERSRLEASLFAEQSKFQEAEGARRIAEAQLRMEGARLARCTEELHALGAQLAHAKGEQEGAQGGRILLEAQLAEHRARGEEAEEARRGAEGRASMETTRAELALSKQEEVVAQLRSEKVQYLDAQKALENERGYAIKLKEAIEVANQNADKLQQEIRAVTEEAVASKQEVLSQKQELATCKIEAAETNVKMAEARAYTEAKMVELHVAQKQDDEARVEEQKTAIARAEQAETALLEQIQTANREATKWQAQVDHEADQLGVHQAQSEWAAQESNRLQGETDTLKAQIDELKAGFEEAQVAKEKAEAEVEQMQAVVEIMGMENEGISTEVGESKKESHARREQIAQLEAQLVETKFNMLRESAEEKHQMQRDADAHKRSTEREVDELKHALQMEVVALKCEEKHAEEWKIKAEGRDKAAMEWEGVAEGKKRETTELVERVHDMAGQVQRESSARKSAEEQIALLETSLASMQHSAKSLQGDASDRARLEALEHTKEKTALQLHLDEKESQLHSLKADMATISMQVKHKTKKHKSQLQAFERDKEALLQDHTASLENCAAQIEDLQRANVSFRQEMEVLTHRGLKEQEITVVADVASLFEELVLGEVFSEVMSTRIPAPPLRVEVPLPMGEIEADYVRMEQRELELELGVHRLRRMQAILGLALSEPMTEAFDRLNASLMTTKQERPNPAGMRESEVCFDELLDVMEAQGVELSIFTRVIGAAKDAVHTTEDGTADGMEEVLEGIEEIPLSLASAAPAPFLMCAALAPRAEPEALQATSLGPFSWMGLGVLHFTAAVLGSLVMVLWNASVAFIGPNTVALPRTPTTPRLARPDGHPKQGYRQHALIVPTPSHLQHAPIVPASAHAMDTRQGLPTTTLDASSVKASSGNVNSINANSVKANSINTNSVNAFSDTTLRSAVLRPIGHFTQSGQDLLGHGSAVGQEHPDRRSVATDHGLTGLGDPINTVLLGLGVLVGLGVLLAIGIKGKTHQQRYLRDLFVDLFGTLSIMGLGMAPWAPSRMGLTPLEPMLGAAVVEPSGLLIYMLHFLCWVTAGCCAAAFTAMLIRRGYLLAFFVDAFGTTSVMCLGMLPWLLPDTAAMQALDLTRLGAGVLVPVTSSAACVLLIVGGRAHPRGLVHCILAGMMDCFGVAVLIGVSTVPFRVPQFM